MSACSNKYPGPILSAMSDRPLRCPRGSRFLWSVAFALLLAVPAAAASQQLISAGSVGEFDWPSPDATISYGDGEFQFGYLRLPEGNGPHPVIVFMHGGCWLSVFDIRYTGMAEQAWADAGYAVWSLEYRRVGNEGGGWPGTFLDVASGTDSHQDTTTPEDLTVLARLRAGANA